MHSILDTDRSDTFDFDELQMNLELRFDEDGSAQSYYAQFSNRKQKTGEDLATLGVDLERFARLVYSECTHEMRDKIACSQFIAALSHGFVKQTLQIKGVSSLRFAVERIKTLALINESEFQRGREWESERRPAFRKQGNEEQEKGKKQLANPKNFRRKDEERKQKECWQYGAKRHFRTECLTLQEN